MEEKEQRVAAENELLHRVLNRLDDIERLIIKLYKGEIAAMSQLDTDIQTLATNFAQDTADQQQLLQALTTAIQNSTADNPTDDPTVQGIITAMQANHATVVTTLQNLGVTVPTTPSPTAAAAVAAAKKA